MNETTAEPTRETTAGKRMLGEAQIYVKGAMAGIQGSFGQHAFSTFVYQVNEHIRNAMSDPMPHTGVLLLEDWLNWNVKSKNVPTRNKQFAQAVIDLIKH